MNRCLIFYEFTSRHWLSVYWPLQLIFLELPSYKNSWLCRYLFRNGMSHCVVIRSLLKWKSNNRVKKIKTNLTFIRTKKHKNIKDKKDYLSLFLVDCFSLFFGLCNDSFSRFRITCLVFFVITIVLRVFISRNLDVTCQNKIKLSLKNNQIQISTYNLNGEEVTFVLT